MALILASHVDPKPILDGYTDSMLGVLPEYRSEKSLVDKIIDTEVCKVERDDNNINLTFNYSVMSAKSFLITPALFQAKTRIVLYYKRSTGAFITKTIDEIFKDRDSFAKLRYVDSIVETPLAEIYFSDSFTNGIVMIKKLPISNEEFIQVDPLKSFSHRILHLFPEVQDLINKDKNKLTVLSNLNPNDSIVALEQQVDLLTTLVSNLINNQSQPSWSSDFLSKVSTSNVTTVRSASDVLTDLDSTKKKIRAAQKTYLDNK